MIQLKAKKRSAICTVKDKLTTGSVGLAVQFAFSEEWEGLSKIAVFRAGDVSIDVALLEDRCTVPPEVLVTPGETLTIGVYGTDAEGTVVIPTVYADAGQIRRGAVPSGVTPDEHTQPLIDQLLAAAQAAQTAADAAETIAQSVRHDADSGALDGASAYEIAVDHGYEGTREQFGKDQAEFAENALAVAEAKETVVAAEQHVVQIEETFTNETVPAATESIENKGTEQVQLVGEKGDEAAQAIVVVGNEQTERVTHEGDTQVVRVQEAKAAAVTDVEQAGETQVGNVNTAGTTNVEAVEAAGSDAVNAVGNAQTAAVQAVQTESSTQQAAVQAKGQETIASIPADYTALIGEVDELKSAIAYSGELKSGYITYNNGTYHSSSTRKYMEFSVSYGMSVKYSFNDGAAYNMGLAFYDAGGKYISGAIAQSQPQIVAVPENAVLCKATARNQEDSVPAYYNSAIQINRISTLSSIKLDNTLFEYQENKYAYWANKNVASYTGINVIVFPVFEGLSFVYSMKNSNPNAVGLHFRNSTGGYISGVQATANPTTVVTPATATVCYASVSNPNEIQFVGVGNSLLQNASSAELNCGLQITSEPLESISDVTGMLDIFLHVGCIGDSLASGESYWNDGGTTQGADFYQYSWGQYLARKTGNKYYNWSKGGLSTKMWLTSEYATECFDGQHLCEAYIIGLGQNDANYNYTIGTSADIDLTNYNNNADTFYGSYGKIIQKIKEVQPQAKIFVVTDPNTSTNNKGYNTPIRDMATIFENVYVVDLQMYALKYMQSPVLIAQLRGGHFNAYGYKVFSMMIANYIDWIVTHDYTEFTQVELIGTGHSWT